MYATVRRYEGIDKVRSGEITRKVGDSLRQVCASCPAGGSYLIDAGGGVLTSVGLFETSAQAHESTRVATKEGVEREARRRTPNTPKITGPRDRRRPSAV